MEKKKTEASVFKSQTSAIQAKIDSAKTIKKVTKVRALRSEIIGTKKTETGNYQNNTGRKKTDHGMGDISDGVMLIQAGKNLQSSTDAASQAQAQAMIHSGEGLEEVGKEAVDQGTKLTQEGTQKIIQGSISTTMGIMLRSEEAEQHMDEIQGLAALQVLSGKLDATAMDVLTDDLQDEAGIDKSFLKAGIAGGLSAVQSINGQMTGSASIDDGNFNLLDGSQSSMKYAVKNAFEGGMSLGMEEAGMPVSKEMVQGLTGSIFRGLEGDRSSMFEGMVKSSTSMLLDPDDQKNFNLAFGVTIGYATGNEGRIREGISQAISMFGNEDLSFLSQGDKMLGAAGSLFQRGSESIGDAKQRAQRVNGETSNQFRNYLGPA